MPPDTRNIGRQGRKRKRYFSRPAISFCPEYRTGLAQLRPGPEIGQTCRTPPIHQSEALLRKGGYGDVDRRCDTRGSYRDALSIREGHSSGPPTYSGSHARRRGENVYLPHFSPVFLNLSRLISNDELVRMGPIFLCLFSYLFVEMFARPAMDGAPKAPRICSRGLWIVHGAFWRTL